MPRGLVAATSPSRDGTLLPAPTTGDPANGHYVHNSGKTLLLVVNGGGSPYDVTVTYRGVIDAGITAPTKVVEVANGTSELFGPYPVDKYGSQIWIDVENAGLTIRAIEPA